MRRTLRGGLVLVLSGLACVVAACPYSIRDAGFIVRDPKPFRLEVLMRPGEGLLSEDGRKQLAQAFETAKEKYLSHSNIQVEVRDFGTEEQVSEADEAAVGSLGLAARLVSPAGQKLTLRVGPQSSAQGIADGIVRQAVDSPLRTQILHKIVADWCAIVVVEGDDTEESASAVVIVAKAAGDIVGFKPEMGDKITKPPLVVKVRWDDPREQVLLWGLGLQEVDPKGAKVAILFGAGRRLGPVLWGGAITELNIKNALRLLGRNCTCTSEPSQILGPTMPRIWDRDRQAEVREVLGFDPNSPAVVSALAGVWTNYSETGEMTPGEFLPDPTSGYIEFPIGDEDDEGAPGEDAPPLNEGQVGKTVEGKSMRAVIAATAVIAAIVIGGSAALLLKQRGRA